MAYILDHRMHIEYDLKFNFLRKLNHFEVEYVQFRLMVFYILRYYLQLHQKNLQYRKIQVLNYALYMRKVSM